MTLPLPAPLDTLSEADQSTLARFLEPVRFAAGERLITAGAEGDSLVIIDEGVARIEVDDDELDTETVIAYADPGSMVGELSLLDRLPRSAHVVAEKDVAARRLTAAALDEIAAQHPRIGIALVMALGRDASRKLRATTKRLADILEEGTADPGVDEYVARAQAAQRQIEDWDEDRIDALLAAIAQAVAQHAAELAAETVKETRMGDVSDKTYKNYVAALGIYQWLAGKPGRGRVRHDAERGVTEIASAAGVVFAIIPMTNPVATAVFKTLIALKVRNALILSFHRAALGVGNRTGAIIRDALVAAGAPTDLVQWISERTSRRKTHGFMRHPGVALILATGGAGLVRAAYSSGTPALGVGPGNAPAWICDDADIDAAAAAVVASKSFDNGLICGAEHNLVVDASVRDAFVAALERAGAAVLNEKEAPRFAAAVVVTETGRFSPRIIGQNAGAIAAFLGIRRDHPIRLVVVPTDDPRPENPFAGEKMAPMLSLFTVRGREEGLALCRRLLDQWGTGHTAVIHSRDAALIERFALAMPASRVLVNSPGTQGVVGLTTGLSPSFTLGCGTFGRNSTTDNVTYTNLMNIKRLARYIEPPAEARALEQHARAEAARAAPVAAQV